MAIVPFNVPIDVGDFWTQEHFEITFADHVLEARWPFMLLSSHHAE